VRSGRCVLVGMLCGDVAGEEWVDYERWMWRDGRWWNGGVAEQN